MLHFSSETIYFSLGLGLCLCLLFLVILLIFQIYNVSRTKQFQDTLLNTLLNSLESKISEKYLLQTQHFSELRLQLAETLRTQSLSLLETLGNHNVNVVGKFKDLSMLLEKRLHEGFEKTATTFTDIVKRLALIDDAQKKLTELSSNVVSLQEILTDKRSRGAFGEIQLNSLVQNMLPPDHYAFQHGLSNGTRADCILFLPEPTGNVVVDAKFPLENFQIMTDFTSVETERKKAQLQFKQDIKKHIQDIASKYILPQETANGAIMFVPAEAVFSEIHAHFPDLVELAQRNNVWLASPTTLMAILTTARAVLKDQATREHIHIIQDHLRHLATDFHRFDARMQNLAKHIEQANQDVQQVQTSAKKISKRFTQIEKAEVNTEILLTEEFKSLETLD